MKPDSSLIINTRNNVNPELIKEEVESGKYVLLVELGSRQVRELKKVVVKHPDLKIAGNHEVFLG